jgi:hypothetical protein
LVAGRCAIKPRSAGDFYVGHLRTPRMALTICSHGATVAP